MRISVSSQNFEDTILDVKDRAVKSTTTKIENKDITFLSILFVKSKSNSSGGRFVNESLNIESSNLSSVNSSLSLRIIKVGGNSNDTVRDLFVHKAFSNSLHLSKNNSRDLLRGEFLFLFLECNINHRFIIESFNDLEGEALHVLLNGSTREFLSHKSLNIVDCVSGVLGLLRLSSFSTKLFSSVEGNKRGSSSKTDFVRHDINLSVLPYSNA